MRLPLTVLAACVAVGAAGPPAALAHSLDDLTSTLGERETYFQPVDKPAPELRLQDADGRPVTLADFRGQVVVLHFVYMSYTDTCPMHASLLAEVQEMVNQTPMAERVRFVTVTTDPENDTPEILRDYGPSRGLDPANWLALTTRPDQPENATRRLAEAFGHSFSKLPDGKQLHGTVTHVVGPRGHWAANFHGLRFDPANLVLFANGLLHVSDGAHVQESGSWWQRLRAWF
jgi:protein SCO1/2